ncbi:hypothetical protein VYU27_007004 [Nannochloropsis oceanica]
MMVLRVASFHDDPMRLRRIRSHAPRTGQPSAAGSKSSHRSNTTIAATMSQAKQNPSKMLVMLPLFFMAQKITYSDDLVTILRFSYYFVQASTLLLLYLYIRNKILATNDRTVMYLPPVPLPFGMGPAADNPRPKEITYLDHELEQVNTLLRSTLIGVAMVSFMHWKMGVKPVLLLQTIMGPMNLFDHGLSAAAPPQAGPYHSSAHLV